MEELQIQFSPEKIAIIRALVDKEATTEEFNHFIQYASMLGLDPLRKEIYLIPRYDRSKGRKAYNPEVSIGGLRVIAERTGLYCGQDGPYFCDKDGTWRDVWLDSKNPPMAAKIGIHRKGFVAPLYHTVLYHESVSVNKGGEASGLWKDKPALMLAKTAEAGGLRRAFTSATSGVYTVEEMDGAIPRDYDGEYVYSGSAVQTSTVKTAKPKPPEPPHPYTVLANYDNEELNQAQLDFVLKYYQQLYKLPLDEFPDFVSFAMNTLGVDREPKAYDVGENIGVDELLACINIVRRGKQPDSSGKYANPTEIDIAKVLREYKNWLVQNPYTYSEGEVTPEPPEILNAKADESNVNTETGEIEELVPMEDPNGIL